MKDSIKDRIKTYLDKKRTDKNGESYIFLTYTFKGREFFYTELKASPDLWDEDEGKINLDKIKKREQKEAAININDEIDETKRKITRTAQRIDLDDMLPIASLVKSKYLEEEQNELRKKELEYKVHEEKPKKKELITFIDYYKEYAKEKTQYNSVSLSTEKKYKTCIEHLNLFIHHRKGVQLYPEDMTVKAFEQPYRHYMRFTYVQNSYIENGQLKFPLDKDKKPVKKIGLAENSIVKDLKTIYSVCKHLFEEGLCTNKDYRKFDLQEYTSDLPPLPPEYFTIILNASFPERPALQKTLDKFIIGCITSLRYEDLNERVLKERVFINKKDLALSYIELRAKKGNKEVTEIYYLTSIGAKILLKYLKDESCGEYALPKLSAKNFNENLKVIGKLLGLNRMIAVELIKREKLVNGKVKESVIEKAPFFEFMSSHMMRRTSVTTMKRKLDDRKTMKQSKHTTRVNLDKYNKFADEELARELDETFSEYV